MTLEKNIGSARLVNADSLQFIKTLPDHSISLIATDPPYFQVKSKDWDNQWSSSSDFLTWVDELLIEFKRVLKPNGSLYFFCSSYLSAEIELRIKEHFNFLNHIVWAKPSGPWLRQDMSKLRSFFPSSERILFAEQKESDSVANDSSGYSQVCSDLRTKLMTPLIEYFVQAKTTLGVSASEINAATGTKMCSHWFSYSQWQLPNRDQYEKLQHLFRDKAKELHHSVLNVSHDELSREYDELFENYDVLKRDYDEFKKEYHLLRRPFSVTPNVPYIDVWTFKPVAYYAGKHPCEKPIDLMEHIVSSSSRPGETVADFFMGSGSTVKAALNLGRQALGVELEFPTFEKTCFSIQENLN